MARLYRAHLMNAELQIQYKVNVDTLRPS